MADPVDMKFATASGRPITNSVKLTCKSYLPREVKRRLKGVDKAEDDCICPTSDKMAMHIVSIQILAKC